MVLEYAKDFLAFTASVSTILQFLTGVLICQKFVQKGSTGDASGFPFVSAFLSCSLWLRYGFLIHDNSIILVNTFGASLQLGYIITYYLYTVKKSVVTRQTIAACTFLVMVLMYTQYEADETAAKQMLGLLCCFTTIVFFAAPLTVLAHVIRVKNAESLPYSLILANFLVSLQWFLYGVIINDTYIQVTNALGTFLSASQLSLFVIYRSDSSVGPVQIR
ncbi:sugar transporter SWEET1-like isoform X2 [Bacillus rossius redtenbacheri]